MMYNIFGDLIMNFNNDNMIFNAINDISFIKFKKLEEFSNIEHAFYIGKDLDFKTKDKNKNFYKDNYKNYQKFLSLFNLDYKNCVKPIYEHYSNYKNIVKKYNINEPDFFIEEYENTDATITNKNNIILTSTSADCNIIFIYDKKNKVISNIHSGWLGTLNEVVINTIKGMKKEYNSNYLDLICCIMPSIRMCHFEVGDDVYYKFKDKFNDSKYYEFINGKWHIDLVSIIIDGLIKMGVDKNNIIDSNICTVCNSNYLHSYRVEKEDFMVSMGFITLKGEDNV